MMTASGGRVDRRHARGEAEREAADDQQDRIRDVQRVGEQEQPQSRDQEQEELKLFVCAERGHRWI